MITANPKIKVYLFTNGGGDHREHVDKRKGRKHREQSLKERRDINRQTCYRRNCTR